MVYDANIFLWYILVLISYILKYQPLITSNMKQKPQRNIICFNPPFSRNVFTNVAKKFLQLLDKHFLPSNSLGRIFNHNAVKVSYCCTQNLGNIIKSHKKKLISSNSQTILSCNSRKKEKCPLEGNSRGNDVLYKCIVSATGFPNKFYLGTTEGEFKKRFYNHNSSFKIELKMNDATLAKHVWD